MIFPEIILLPDLQPDISYDKLLSWTLRFDLRSWTLRFDLRPPIS
jgi:hypothetical protein